MLSKGLEGHPKPLSLRNTLTGRRAASEAVSPGSNPGSAVAGSEERRYFEWANPPLPTDTPAVQLSPVTLSHNGAKDPRDLVPLWDS